MSVDLSSFLSVTYGGATLRAKAYTWLAAPQVREGVQHIVNKITVEVTAWVEAQTQEDFQSAMSAAIAALQTDGQLLTIYGLGGAAAGATAIENQLNPLNCLYGGPNPGYEVIDGVGPLHRYIKARFVAVVAVSTVDSYRMKVDTRPDKLITVTRAGEIVGPGASGLYPTTLSNFSAIYAPPAWVLNSQADTSYDLTNVRYTITAIQLADAMESCAGAQAVDGEATTTISIDEQLVNTTVQSYDLTITGDPTALYTSLRPDTTQVYLTRESMATTAHRRIGLRCSFTTIEGQWGGDLLTWEQTFEQTTNDESYAEKTYIGADPVAVRKPTPLAKVIQRGRATGVSFITAPDPISTNYAEPPRINYTQVTPIICETRWVYTMLSNPSDDSDPLSTLNPSTLGRPL